MKPIAAIVEPALDVDLLVKQITVALADERHAETSARRWEQQAVAARETAKVRRREIGELLLKARGAWPERGPNAKGWGEFLGRVGLEQSTAWRYMEDIRNPVSCDAHEKPDPPRGDRDPKPASSPAILSEADVLAAIAKLDPAARKRVAKELKPATVSGGSGDVDRGTWCTSKLWADRVGPWDLDPFSNPRSHIVSTARCMLEDGGNGLAKGVAGTFQTADQRLHVAMADTRVWIQPPYEVVLDAIAHYGHTRFCALLRLDSSTEWFAKLWERTQVIALAKGTREFFEPPPGVEGSTNPQPHALYYADPRDITPAVAESCVLLTRYEAQALPALHIVR